VKKPEAPSIQIIDEGYRRKWDRHYQWYITQTLKEVYLCRTDMDKVRVEAEKYANARMRM
jgi:hypothetical protein